ncbi:MAG TPA: extracellular solute-binding protein, partial [Ignavibacteriales bacterium]|nr:extracellular solute-binding protein [Ignavibacteriales bacterium]
MRLLSSLAKYALLTLLVIFSFAGCQKKDENEIVIWHNMRPEEKNILDRQLREYMKLHPDVHVIQLYKETEEMRSGYIVAAIGGQGPDLIYGPSDQVGPFEEMNIVLPLDTIFSKDYLSKFNEKAL